MGENPSAQLRCNKYLLIFQYNAEQGQGCVRGTGLVTHVEGLKCVNNPVPLTHPSSCPFYEIKQFSNK